MQSDWYKTKMAGTYLVVPSGIKLSSLELPSEYRSLIDARITLPFAENVDSHAQGLRFERAGVDDCLKHRGYCIIRK